MTSMVPLHLLLSPGLIKKVNGKVKNFNSLVELSQSVIPSVKSQTDTRNGLFIRPDLVLLSEM